MYDKNYKLMSSTAMATVLLCTNLGLKDKDIKPFNAYEWFELSKKIFYSDVKDPGNILSNEITVDCLAEDLNISRRQATRILVLLNRYDACDKEIERYNRDGIYIVTKSDENYPTKLKEKLGNDVAPPVLFYAGDIKLLNEKGVALVGSRGIDEEDEKVTRKIVKGAVDHKYVIITGGAKGVGSTATKAAINANGYAVEFLACNMLNLLNGNEYKNKQVENGHLLLISAAEPMKKFNVPSAMDRNKYVYGLSEFAVVVASDTKGGTWTGAMDCIKHNWVPVTVVENEKYKGNKVLLENGAVKYAF